MTDEDLCASWAPSPSGSAPPHEHAHAPGADSAPVDPSPPYTWYGYAVPTPPPATAVVPSGRAPRRGRTRVAIGGLAVVGLLGAGWVTRGALDPTSTVSTAQAERPAAAPVVPTPLVPGDDEEPVTAVAKALGPSVVLIKTASGLGSGVVYDSDGLIMTNAHVVGSATTVNVHLGDGQTLEGTVLGADASTDMAVVRVSADRGLVAARLAEQAPTVGQLAVALGSPFGLDETVTAGVVSAINRPVDNGNGGVSSMIQTDAPINPGNSGGALANRRAEVIGINSMIYSEKGENNGIGFAIPIDRAKDVADTIVNGGSLDRAYLGVASEPTTDGQPGAVITKVEPGSAADIAGLETGDVVVAIDGEPIKQGSDLAARISTKSPGDRLQVEVERDGATTTIEVTLGAKTAPTAEPDAPEPSTPRPRTPQR